VTLVPPQKVLSASELVRTGVGKILTVLTIFVEVALQPLELVTITSTDCPLVNVVVVKVVDALFCTLKPSTLKLKLVPPPAVKVTLVPAQNILSASELVSTGTGKSFTITIEVAIPEHPPGSVTVNI
jgi:hypothetical protein